MGFGENASTYRRKGRDAERVGRNEEAQQIYAQAPRYRQLKATKNIRGKIRTYKNLRVFNGECPTRGGSGIACELKNIRQLIDGSGMASIHVVDYRGSTIKPSKTGTWRLHFASFDVLVDHLKRRVNR